MSILGFNIPLNGRNAFLSGAGLSLGGGLAYKCIDFIHCYAKERDLFHLDSSNQKIAFVARRTIAQAAYVSFYLIAPLLVAHTYFCFSRQNLIFEKSVLKVFLCFLNVLRIS